MLLQMQIERTHTHNLSHGCSGWTWSMTCGVCFVVCSLESRKSVSSIVSIANGQGGTWLQSASETYKKEKTKSKMTQLFRKVEMWNLLESFVALTWHNVFVHSFHPKGLQLRTDIIILLNDNAWAKKHTQKIVSNTMRATTQKCEQQKWRHKKDRKLANERSRKSEIPNTKAYEIRPYFCNSFVVSFVCFFHASFHFGISFSFAFRTSANRTREQYLCNA